MVINIVARGTIIHNTGENLYYKFFLCRPTTKGIQPNNVIDQLEFPNLLLSNVLHVHNIDGTDIIKVDMTYQLRYHRLEWIL